MKRSNAWERRFEDLLHVLQLWFLRPVLKMLEGDASRRTPPPVPGRVLLCKSCCLGDAVLSLYAIRAFKQVYPDCRVEILCSERIREVYEDSPYLDAVHALPVTGRRLLRELLSPRFGLRLLGTLWRLRQARYDEFIDLELYRNYGVTLKRLLGIPRSRGFHVEGHEAPPHDFVFFRGRHDPEWRCFFGVLGLPLPAAIPPPLYAEGWTLKKAADTIGLVFGSSFNWPEKKWPLEYFASVISQLLSTHANFVLYGSPLELAESRQLALVAPGRIRSTVGQLDFNGLKKSLSQCDLVFGNDTGSLHVAAACGVPVLALFGPTSPQKWKPLTAEALWVENLPCRPCYYLGSMPDCPHRNCLRQLQPERVTAAIQKLLPI